VSFRSRLLPILAKYLNKPISPEKSFLCDFERIKHEIRLCDVLLVEGRSRVSRIIRGVSNSAWTHAALYIGRISDIEDTMMRETIQNAYQGSPRDRLLIETIVGFGTKVSPLHEYEKDHIRICRPVGLHHEDAQKIINYTIGHIGYPYNMRQVFDLWRYYLGWFFIPRKWLSSLFHYKSTPLKEDVCSVLIASAFKEVKFPIRPLIRSDDHQKIEMIHRNPWLTAPADFDFSPYFDIVKYPILPTAHHSGYRNLPWNEDFLSNDDQGVTDHPKENQSNARLNNEN